MAARCCSWIAALFFILVVQHTAAFEFRVGGREGWIVPAGNQTESYNHWAGRNRFQVGDSLLFKFKTGGDSVLQVTEESYAKCKTFNPIQYSEYGEAIFLFRKSGAFYFISGAAGHCQRGQKLVVVVMAVRNVSAGWKAPGPSQFSGAPSPSSTVPGVPSTSPTPMKMGPSPFLPSSPVASPASDPPLVAGLACRSITASACCAFLVVCSWLVLELL